MKALVIEKPGSAQLDDLPPPRAGPTEAQVRVLQAGICGSDVEILNGTRPADFVTYPVVPGHEWIGEVVATGDRVADLPPGTRVVGENFRPCFRCPRCAEGMTNLCLSDYQEAGFTLPGAFAEYLCVDRRFLHVLPKSVPLAVGALIEPAACVAQGILELGVRPASSCAVVGAGTLGILALHLLRLSSPSRLLAVDRRPDRLDAVRAICGADVALAAADRLDSRLESSFDLVVVTADSPHAAAAALRLARRGGDVLYEGIAGDPVATVSPDDIVLKHLRVQGIFGASRAAWSWMVEVASSGLLRAEKLVTHLLSLEEHEEAFRLAQGAAPGTLKVQFVM
jgi:threonine dehydrogenase-like Zn-dependent dehydrogenase